MSSGRSTSPINRATSMRQYEPPSSALHDTRPDYSVSSNDFILFQLMLEVILRFPRTLCARKELFERHSEYHQHNRALIQEVQSIYIKKGPIPLFTRDCFFFALLNKALRYHDYHTLFSVRHLIISLHDHLQCLRETIDEKLTVYRGQIISQRELNSLSIVHCPFIYWPNFASTSRNRGIALQFAQSGEMRPGYYRILFHIHIYPQKFLSTNKPFAAIDHLTTYKQEEEVLVMAGTVFQLCDKEPTWNDTDHVWTVHLDLKEDYNQQLELHDLLEYHKKTLPSETGLLSAARAFRAMGRINEAHTHLERLASQLPEDDLLSRAKILFEDGRYQQALDLFIHTLNLRRICAPYANIQIGLNCKYIGDTHFALNDYASALRYYELALKELSKSGKCSDQNLFVSIGLSIGRAQHSMRHFKEAESTLYSVFNGNDLLHLAECLDELGRLRTTCKEHTHALDFHRRALDLREKYLPQHHPDLSKSYKNIADVQASLPGEVDNAMHSYHKARESLRKTYPLDHTMTQEVDEKIRSISNRT